MTATETRRRASERYRDARDLGARLDPATPAISAPATRRDAATVADVLAAAANLARAFRLASCGLALTILDQLADD